jgi:deoxyhypusine synthase
MKKNHFNEGLKKSHHTQYGSLKECLTLEGHPKVEGHDFEKGLNFKEFLKAYSKIGFQATHLSQGMEIVKAMRREKATIFLGFTSNIISSGLREIIKYLVKHKKVDVLVTSAGGIEEDIIKSLKPFVLGQFDVPGRTLFEHGINRTGNIFIPNDRYTYFDKFMQDFFQKIYQKQKETGKVYCPKDFIRELGLAINDKSSVLYWAAKNNIPVFCPGIVDGSIGDLIVFFKQSHPDFLLDVSKEVLDITKITLNAEKTGAILLGGGISKHFVLNANIFREGLDYAVYINTAQEYDGSDSGARIEEAITWGKVKTTAPCIKIHGDATIIFPLLVAGSLVQEEEKKTN